MSVRPSVCVEQLGRHWLDSKEICYLNIFKKSVGKIQLSLKSDKNKGYFTGDQYTFLIISRLVLLRIKNVSDKSCRETRNTHFMFNKVYSKIVSFMR